MTDFSTELERRSCAEPHAKERDFIAAKHENRGRRREYHEREAKQQTAVTTDFDSKDGEVAGDGPGHHRHR